MAENKARLDKTKEPWSKEVRYRLIRWFHWANGNHYYQNPDNPIAALMKRAEGYLPGEDCDIPRDLTFELEVTEKSVARMKNRREKVYRRLLIDTYLNGKYLFEIALDKRWSEEKTSMMLWRAESIVGRYMIEVEKDLTASKNSGNVTAFMVG